MAVELFRIDDRLIHGQVVVGWGQPLDIQRIVMVDDAVAASEWERELYRMGVPEEMSVEFLTVDAALAALDAILADARRTIVLTGDVETMRRLVAGSAGRITTVNIGGLHHRSGRAPCLRYVYLTPEEREGLQAIESLGVTVTAQDVPVCDPVPLSDVLASTGA
ncbi:MAG: PTS sugar transporter subunit IIB [Gemmatimonadaceae bacterium]|nr:PTS sugar transporter subunit IIB [Gemmatimonadaceae bacterium]